MPFDDRKWTEMKLVTTSLCPCGHPTMVDTVTVGTPYRVDLDSKMPYTMLCGGCNSAIPVEIVFVFDERDGGGWLPFGVFEETGSIAGGRVLSSGS